MLFVTHLPYYTLIHGHFHRFCFFFFFFPFRGGQPSPALSEGGPRRHRARAFLASVARGPPCSSEGHLAWASESSPRPTQARAALARSGEGDPRRIWRGWPRPRPGKGRSTPGEGGPRRKGKKKKKQKRRRYL